MGGSYDRHYDPSHTSSNLPASELSALSVAQLTEIVNARLGSQHELKYVPSKPTLLGLATTTALCDLWVAASKLKATHARAAQKRGAEDAGLEGGVAEDDDAEDGGAPYAPLAKKGKPCKAAAHRPTSSETSSMRPGELDKNRKPRGRQPGGYVPNAPNDSAEVS